MSDNITSLFSRWIKWEVCWDSNDELGFRMLTISYLIQRSHCFTFPLSLLQEIIAALFKELKGKDFKHLKVRAENKNIDPAGSIFFSLYF